MTIDFSHALAVAVDAARAAGAIMEQYRGTDFTVTHKGVIDIVTEVDVACEKVIVQTLKDAFPDHGILAEEGGGDRADNGVTWIVDPLDGTTNFAHGFPIYCSSIALVVDGVPQVGVVYDPTRDELFSAIKGEGAQLNGRGLKVSQTADLTNALLATGFPYAIRTTPVNNLSQFSSFAMKAQAIRRPGAAAIDLCYVATGRLDGFWEYHLKPWDLAAGALIVQEAGGWVSATDGAPFDVTRADIVASNGVLHEIMLATLAQAS
jgi:myo-inositol-1(or 4)-monophosphatase